MIGFSVLDIGILILFLYFILGGYKKGFVKQTSAILGLIVSLIIAVNYYRVFQPYLQLYIKAAEEIVQFISFSILFILVNLFIHLLGMVLKNILNLLYLDPLDHVIGAALGLIKGGFVSYLLVLLLAQIPYSDITRLVNGSFMATNLLDITPIIQQNLENIFRP